MIGRGRYYGPRKFTSRDDGTGPGAHRDPSPTGSLRIIYDFYYAVKMREFLRRGHASVARGSTRR